MAQSLSKRTGESRDMPDLSKARKTNSLQNMRNIVVTARDYTLYLLLRTLVCILQAVPLSTGRRIARGLASLFTDYLPARQKLLKKNLEIAFPELDAAQQRELGRRMWEHLFLMLVEIAHAPRKVREMNWRRHMHLVGVRPLLAYLRQDRPVIIVTGHYGNFEMGGYLLGVLGYPTHSVARTLDNRFVNDFVKRFREKTGQFLISKNEGYEDILEVLASNGTMAFLADQSAGPKGCFVDFFGKPASVYKAIALLSLQYDAPIVVCASTREPDRPLFFRMHAAARLDPRDLPEDIGNIKEVTQWYTSQLEERIREHPEQYWWIHNRWKDTPRGHNPRPQVTAR